MYESCNQEKEQEIALLLFLVSAVCESPLFFEIPEKPSFPGSLNHRCLSLSNNPEKGKSRCPRASAYVDLRSCLKKPWQKEAFVAAKLRARNTERAFVCFKAGTILVSSPDRKPDKPL